MAHRLSIHPLIPRPYGQHPACDWCQQQLADEHVVDEAPRGFVQVIHGEDAFDVVDVTYVCPCGVVHVVRMQK